MATVQLLVVVPEGALPGSMMQCQAPGGPIVQVQVPEGAPPGTQLQLEVPAGPSDDPNAEASDPESEPDPDPELESAAALESATAGASRRAEVHGELSAFDGELRELRTSAVAALGGLQIPNYETSIGTKAALMERVAIKVSRSVESVPSATAAYHCLPSAAYHPREPTNFPTTRSQDRQGQGRGRGQGQSQGQGSCRGEETG